MYRAFLLVEIYSLYCIKNVAYVTKRLTPKTYQFAGHNVWILYTVTLMPFKGQITIFFQKINSSKLGYKECIQKLLNLYSYKLGLNNLRELSHPSLYSYKFHSYWTVYAFVYTCTDSRFIKCELPQPSVYSYKWGTFWINSLNRLSSWRWKLMVNACAVDPDAC